ncbi:MFS transporter [Micromonospora chersina]|uniref:MFS transporter n=1 Tax=Micromonospora chersina TaxID=47854 RepID=UPI0037A8C9C1
MISARPQSHGYRAVLAHGPLRRLLPAFAVSDLGDGMSVVTVAWLALQIAPSGASGMFVGAAVAAYILPGAAGALAFSRWLRRLPTLRLIQANAWTRAGFLGCIPLAWVTGTLHPALYVALLAGSSLLHAWGGSAKYALVAELVPDEQRLAANALLSTSAWVSTIIGPALAGLLTVAIAPALLIGLDALSFGWLAVQVGRLAGPRQGSLPPPEKARLGNGLRVLRTRPALLGLLTVTWLFNLAYGPVEVALPLFVRQVLRAGPDVLGLYWAAFGVGAVVGALTVGVVRKLPLWPVMLTIIAGHGLAMLPFGLPVPVTFSVVSFAFAGVIYGPYSALAFTLLQSLSPAALLTTVLAIRATVLLTASPVGAAIGGPLAASLGARWTLAGTGIVMIAVAALAAIPAAGMTPALPQQGQMR